MRRDFAINLEASTVFLISSFSTWANIIQVLDYSNVPCRRTGNQMAVPSRMHLIVGTLINTHFIFILFFFFATFQPAHNPKKTLSIVSSEKHVALFHTFASVLLFEV